MQYVGHYAGVAAISTLAYNASGEIWNGGAFVAPVDADIADYRIAITTDDSGSLYATLPTNTVRYETRLDGASFPLSELIWEDVLPVALSPEFAAYVMAQLALLSASTANPPDNGPTIFGELLTAETDNRWQHSISFPGYEFTGWETITFSIKQRYREDDDNEALLIVRVSNPADGATDGIIVQSRNVIDAADALRGRATVTVDDDAPNALITVTLNAEALNLLPSPDTEPYEYEINLWRNGDKEQAGKGPFKLNQSVLRNTVAP